MSQDLFCTSLSKWIGAQVDKINFWPFCLSKIGNANISDTIVCYNYTIMYINGALEL